MYVALLMGSKVSENWDTLWKKCTQTELQNS